MQCNDYVLIIILLAILVLAMTTNCCLLLGMSTCGVTAYLCAYIKLYVFQEVLVGTFFISKFVHKLFSCLRKLRYIYLVFRTFLNWCHPCLKKENDQTNNKSFESSSTSQFFTSQHCGNSIALETEIDSIVFEISEKYIRPWYDKVSENKDFIGELNIIIRDSLLAACTSILSIERHKFCFHVLQIYLHYFHHDIEAQSEELGKTVENFKMKHWASKDQATEWCYLQNLMSKILDSFGTVEYHNALHSKSSFLLHIMVVEILTENMVYPFLNILTDSSHLNAWLLNSLTNDMQKEYIEAVKHTGTSPQKYDYSLLKTFPDSEKEYKVSTPIILVSTEGSPCKSNESAVECSSNLSSSGNMFDISNSKNEIKSETDSLDVSFQNSESDDENSFEAATANLSTAGLKSRSNINIFHTMSTTTMSENIPSAYCDGSLIKRSKSADYIRQMSEMDELIPLSAKNSSIKLHGRNNKTFVIFNYEGGDIEEAEEATEVELPPLFTDVKIIDTLQQVDLGPLPYTLYCIQYSGIFHDRRKSTNAPELVNHVVSIKRRFREFVALQSRLEDNVSLRAYLKGIKGPSKWLATPFSSLDKKNISERKSFLENYLQELCRHNAITRSSELQEFLAYGGDASIAFVKKAAADISVPRIDKMLFRGMKGAIDMFRTALPNSPEVATFSEPNIPKPLLDETNYEYRFHDFALEYNNRESAMQEHIRNYFQHLDESASSESLYDGFKLLEEKLKRPSLMRQMFELKADDYCDCKNIIDSKAEGSQLTEKAFGDIAIDLIIESFQKSFIVRECYASLSKELFSHFINNFIVKKLDGISEEKFALWLHMLHKSLWDTDYCGKDDPKATNLEDVKTKVKEILEAHSSSNYIMQIMRSNLIKVIDVLLSSIQDQQLNRYLLFHIFDEIFETTCSKEEHNI